MAGTLEQVRQQPLHEGWLARPALARSLRVAIFCVPLLCSLGVTLAVAALLPPQSALLGRVLSSVVILALGIAAHRATAHLANRLLPLASLLRISMALPDAAPSRFSIALRRGSTRQLERPGDTAVEATTADEILRLVKALNHHDRATRGHSERVRAYSELIGREIGLSNSDLELLRWAALLHDVGKLEVPADILDKDGRPTDEEFELIRNHTVYGSRMIAPLTPWLGEWAWAVLQHHERWDGNGYPHGIAGDEISLAGRIVAVADVFDVMTSVRSYKKAQSFDQAREELVRCAGTQFDPAIVRAFLRVSQAKLRSSTGLLSGAAGLLQVGSAAAPSTVGPVAGAVGAATSAAVAATIGGYLAPVEAPFRPPSQQQPESVFDDFAARVTEALESTTTTSSAVLPIPPDAPLLVLSVEQDDVLEIDLLEGVDDERVSAKLRSAPLFGVLTEVAPGRVRYEPDPEASGDDSFDFAYCIDDRCTEGRVGIEIIGPVGTTVTTAEPASTSPPVGTPEEPTTTTSGLLALPPGTTTIVPAPVTTGAPSTGTTGIVPQTSTSAPPTSAATPDTTATTTAPTTTRPSTTQRPTTTASTTTAPATTTTASPATTTTTTTTSPPPTTTSSTAPDLSSASTPQITATVDADKSIPASGAISGDLFIHVAGDSTVDTVTWFVDDIYGKQAPHQIENHAPFDFGGTIGRGPASRPLDTTTLSNGSHTVTAKVTEYDGTVRWQNYTFWVDNG